MTTTTAPPHRAAVPTGRDSFGRLVRAEFTKLRSVRRWLIGLFVAAGLTLLGGFTGASASSAEHEPGEPISPIGPDGDPVQDELHLVHQPLAGGGSITAQVTSQANSQEWAAAGLIVRESIEPGSQYAAVMVTPGHGVQFQVNYDNANLVAGSDSAAPRWLRLVRAGDEITGYESADGATWSQVGAIELDGLPETVEVGMYVTSPPQIETDRNFGSTSSGGGPTVGTATFENVQLEPAPPSAQWQSYDAALFGPPGSSTEEDGVFTISGSGALAPAPWPDSINNALTGLLVGQIAIIAVAVLFITSEYKRGMIRTTLAVSPRRGRVLAAKAIVIGAATFAVGLVTSVAVFFLIVPVLESNGFGPPWYPDPSLTDGPVLRALVGSAVYLALVAVFSLGVATIFRRSAGAIALLILLFVVPSIVVGGLPLTAAQWLIRTTPAAGQAITRTVEPNPLDAGAAIEMQNWVDPWPGMAVLAAWAAGALALGYWRLRRRDA